MKKIKAGRYEVLVDDEDYDFLNRLRWKASEIDGKIYASHFLQSSRRKPTAILMHQLLMDTKQGHAIWHKDKNTLNNQKSNLMHLSFSLLRAGSAPKTRESSKYKGVSWKQKEQRWVATCKDKFLGSFKNEVEAARAYDVEAYNQYGEFAYQNFPMTAR